jgi:hypothetical protein
MILATLSEYFVILIVGKIWESFCFFVGNGDRIFHRTERHLVWVALLACYITETKKKINRNSVLCS